MRDLYLRLGIAKQATPEALSRATQRCPNQSLRADAQAALGSPERRAEYDDIHRLLSDIGQLRAGLGLTHAPHWHGDAANDFSPMAAPAAARQQLLTRKLDVALRHFQTRRRRRAWASGAIASGLVAAYLVGRLLG
ncbi:hypothetical protein [Salinicola sp. CR57]|uniref:hypothetical protein n=1 Tax=Salinicola sp. CR57 TaxID=1949086 RepID=UPI000DA2265D|nr:hypothetical protein [Salinicola sp. CR57]